MRILMTGLDYKRAELSVRERFAFTKEHTKQLLTHFAKTSGIGGCALISTCNRTEVYVSAHKDLELTKMLCDFLALNYQEYNNYFTERTEDEALRHLCKTAAGMDSQILGDDQIVTQIRESLELSRELGCTDSYIETCFRTAIKVGKRIKTEIVIRDPRSSSAPYKSVIELKKLCNLAEQNVLVIGNGHMGRMVAELLIKEKANVTVTLREYKKGVITVPNHAATILYSERYKAISCSNIVISATTSPHYTLHYEDFRELHSFPKFIVDLAVPRDVEPCIKDLGDITLLTIDDLADNEVEIPLEKMMKVEEIIDKDLQRYNEWRNYKESKGASR